MSRKSGSFDCVLICGGVKKTNRERKPGFALRLSPDNTSKEEARDEDNTEDYNVPRS